MADRLAGPAATAGPQRRAGRGINAGRANDDDTGDRPTRPGHLHNDARSIFPAPMTAAPSPPRPLPTCWRTPVMAHHSRDQAFIGHSGWIRRFWRRFGGHFRTLVRASRPDWTIGLATTSEAGITGRRRRQSPTPAVRQNDNYRQTVAPAIDGTRRIDRRYEAEIRFELHTRVKRRLLCWDDGFAWFPRPRDAPSPSSR